MKRFIYTLACLVLSIGAWAQNVAKIGTQEYATLADAVAAVPTDGSATTITMLENVDLTTTIAVVYGQNVVLDLINHNITSTVLAIKNQGDLEVTGTGNITVNGTKNTLYGISNAGAAGKKANLIIGENVSITAPCVAVYTAYGKTIVNGTLANTQADASNIYSTLRLSQTSSEVIVTASAKVTGVVNAIFGDKGILEVNSTNVGKIYADGSATQGLKIKKTTAIEGLNVYGHAEFSDVADYYVAAKAISACTGTVKLLSDINAALAVSSGKTVTLDLNGHKVSAESYPIKVEGNLTITGVGTVQSTGMGSNTSVQAAAYVLKDGKLTIESGNYVAGYEGAEGNPAVYVRDNAVVEIKGGDFVGGSKFLLNKLDASRETSVIEVTGGTFHNNFNPADNVAEGEHTNFVADGYKSVDNGDGTFSIKEIEYVAQIGGNKYESLAEAITASQNGETITLLADVTDNIRIPADKNITLDLGEYTLNGKQTTNTPTIKNLGTLIVKNGSVRREGEGSASWYVVENEGTITMDEGLNVEGSANASLIRNNAATAQMTFNAGTYTQTGAFIVVKNDLGNVVVNDGTFSTADNKNVLNNWDQMTINGGTFTGNIFNGAYDTDNNKLTINDGTFNTSQIRTYLGNGKTSCPIEIKGGTFTNAQMKYVGTGNKESDTDVQVAVSGGTFKNPVPEKYCASNFIPKDNGDDTYGVKNGSYVAQIGEDKYESLSHAVAAATEGQTIKLIADINESVTNSNTKNFTIDLNGKTWTSNSYTFINNGGTVTLQGEEGTVKSTAADGIAVWARTGSIIINGGNFENCSNEEATVYVGTTDANLDGKQPTITINGGSFKNTAEGVYKWNTSLLPLTLNIINNIANADTYQAIVVNGGTFFGNDPSVGDDSQLNKINNNSNFVNSEKHAEYKDGVFTIKEGGYKAQTGYIKYVTLDDAIDAAPESATTITLLTNTETTKETLPTNVTIDANSKVLTMPSFVVLDGEAFALPNITGAETYKVTKATYKRTNISATEWGTVCLPFSLTNGNGADYYTYNNISGSALTVDKTTSTVAPNTPVVFKKAKGGDLEINQTDAIVSLDKTPSLASGALVGTYTDANITADGNIYFINGDLFHQAQVSVKVPMYRVYINNSTSSGAKPRTLSIVVADNDATAIEALDTDAAVNAIYDASGRKLSAPQKGINIMKLENGKTVKVMIK